MSPTTASRVAKRIARDLFTNGAKEHAVGLRLLLDDGKNGGGWSERAVVDRVRAILLRVRQP